MTSEFGSSRRIVIIASSLDPVALELPARLARPDVVVVTPADLSLSGWRYRPGARKSVIVAAGQVLHSDDIAAVITRLPRVSAGDLPHIVDGDREYVAAEMAAFLLAWLSDLRCPIANRPSPNCLCGPSWRHERWIREASRAGLSVAPARRVSTSDGAHYQESASVERATVTVVGKQCFGSGAEQLKEEALQLARAAHVETLTVHFNDSGQGMRFFTANPWPSLEEDVVARALLHHLGPPAVLGT